MVPSGLPLVIDRQLQQVQLQLQQVQLPVSTIQSGADIDYINGWQWQRSFNTAGDARGRQPSPTFDWVSLSGYRLYIMKTRWPAGSGFFPSAWRSRAYWQQVRRQVITRLSHSTVCFLFFLWLGQLQARHSVLSGSTVSWTPQNSNLIPIKYGSRVRSAMKIFYIASSIWSGYFNLPAMV
jgi:hypothetical protein